MKFLHIYAFIKLEVKNKNKFRCYQCNSVQAKTKRFFLDIVHT